MTNEEKQELITKLKLRIAYFEELQISGPESFSNHQKDTLYFYRIALVKLTAQPVKLPQAWASDNGNDLLDKDRVISAIRAAGYEVQE